MDENESFKYWFKILGNACKQIIHLCNIYSWRFVNANVKFVVRGLLFLLITSNVIWLFLYNGNKVIKDDIKSQYDLRVDSIQKIVDIQDAMIHNHRLQDSLKESKAKVIKKSPKPRIIKKTVIPKFNPVNDSINK